MILGSHNTMTYLKPKNWFMKAFNFIAKCQSKDYKSQYKCGARYFDLRFKPSKNINDEPTIAHGLMDYKTQKGFIDEFLKFLNSKKNQKIYVRLMYELQKKDKSSDSLQKEHNFIELCKQYQKKYPNIHFIGGRRKYDWKTLVQLEEEPCKKDLYASMDGSKYDDLYPASYAKKYNKQNWAKYKNVQPDCYMLIDFI